METVQLKEELVELIRRVAERDRSAFERLYQMTSRKMFAVAMRITRETGMAQDVLQDAYIRLWRYAHTFNSKLSSPETWIHQIVRNRALDLVSQTSNTVNTIPLEVFGGDDDSSEILSDEAQGSGDQNELRDVMSACVSKLEGKYRQVLTLAYTHGMSHAEISTHLEVPLGTVKTWARRGLLELRALYEQHGLEGHKGGGDMAVPQRGESEAAARGYM